MVYVDSHAHFDLCIEEGAGRAEELLAGMHEGGVCHAVQISIDVDGLEWARDFAVQNRGRGVLFSLGIHPSSRADANDLIYLSDFVKDVMQSADSRLLFGIGEAGLDYYRMRRPREEQIRSFEYQAGLAKNWDLPLIVHSRDAMDDAISLLREFAPLRGVMHCFSGGAQAAGKVLDLGFYISFAGNLTYKTAVEMQEAARFVPLDRLLLETDAPFLSPVPLRGKRNRPENVTHTYEFCAGLRRESLSRLADAVLANFTALRADGLS